MQQHFAFLRSHVGQVEVGVTSGLEFRAEGALRRDAGWPSLLGLFATVATAVRIAFVRQPFQAFAASRLASITRHREWAEGILRCPFAPSERLEDSH